MTVVLSVQRGSSVICAQELGAVHPLHSTTLDGALNVLS